MSTKTNRVVVVGGGLAGLSVAWKLKQAGLPVLVLEKTDRPGGRSCGERVAGFSVERRLPLISTGDDSLLEWVEELGLRDLCLPLRPVQATHLYGDQKRVVRSDSLRALARTPGFGWRDRLRIVRLPRLMRRYRPLLDARMPEKAEDLDFRSVGDFTRLYFGPRVLAQWVAPMLAEATGGSADEASRVAFLLQWEKEQAGRFALLRSGLEEIARAASEKLSMRYGHQVERITPCREGFDISCSTQAGGDESLKASAVVLAVSPMAVCSLAGESLSLCERDALEPFRYTPGATLCIASSEVRTAVPQFVRVPAGEGSPIQSYLVEPGEQAGRAPAGAGLVTLTAREDFLVSRGAVSDEVLAKDLLAAFSVIEPEIVSEVRFSKLHRSSEAQPCMDVGAYRRLARFAKLQPALRAEGRRLYFAGDYLSGPRIDDAVASGRRAGRAVLDDMANA